uniref:Hexosyltransferase n=2 Tax=Clastoptera arizonana TaxID=38151 RepID=A0A1B6CA38_9HEMI
MMAFRVRVLHSVILTLIGLTFIFYTSYYTNSVQVYHIETKHEEINNSKSIPTLQLETSSLISKEALPTVALIDNVQPTHTKTSNVKSNHVIQIIKRKGENEGAKSSKKILTRSMYEAGHNISSTDLCPEFGAQLKLMVAVTSAPQHKDARMAVRQTWGHFGQRKDVVIAFVVGLTLKSDIEAGISMESEMYGDIIQGKFVDSYDNLTLKTVSILEWVDNYCSHARFVLKTDDDMFINMPKLLEFVDSHWNSKRTIFGRLAKKWKPIRNSRSKYYASVDQFPPSVFPDFTTGPAYLLTGDTIHELYENALDHTYLKLEDVFTTGIIAQAIHVKRVHVNEFLNKRIPFNVCNIKKRNKYTYG